ncbi:hypothetical protein OKW32_000188 [Paraburkholderia youngii]
MSCIGDFPSHVRPFVERASPAGDAGVPLYETCARGAVCRHKRRSALHHGSDNGKSLANEVQHKQCGERRHDPRSVDRPATPSFTDTHGALRHRAVNRHACRLQRRRHGQVAAYGSLPTAATRTVLQPAAMTKRGLRPALSGWVRVPVPWTRLCIFDANRFAEGVPPVQQVGDDYAFAFLRRKLLRQQAFADAALLMREICASTSERTP